MRTMLMTSWLVSDDVEAQKQAEISFQQRGKVTCVFLHPSNTRNKAKASIHVRLHATAHSHSDVSFRMVSDN